MLPFNFGVTYQLGEQPFRPYVGGDFTLTPYTADFDMAPGLRARGGFNYLMNDDNVGLNVNLAAGFWYGSELSNIAAEMTNTGLVPQISVGSFFAF